MGRACVIVLAAGAGRRFVQAGGTGSKLDALLGPRRVLDWCMDAVRASGVPMHVQSHPQSNPRSHLESPSEARTDPVGRVASEPLATGSAGMGDSIASAVHACSGAAGWIIVPGDMPFIDPALIREAASLLERGDQSLIVRARHAGRAGHPVGFGRGWESALRSLSGERGASRLLEGNDIRWLESMDDGVLFDIDTPDALEAAHDRLRTLAPPASPLLGTARCVTPDGGASRE